MQVHYEEVYAFMSEIEATVYDYTKCILIDAECLKYKPSMIVSAVISITMEVYLLVKFPKSKLEHQPLSPKLIDEMEKCCNIWDDLV